MYKLYARKNTGSAAVEALLAAIGVQFELVDVVKTPEAKAPDWYYAINPRGEVPTLQLPDGSVMTESAAMMIYLADAHPEAAMAPAIGEKMRAQFLRWMVYLAATPYSTDLRMYYSARYSTDPDHAEAIKAKAVIDLEHDFEVFASGMGEGPLVLGERMSAVDIFAAMLMSWSNDVEGLFLKYPKLKRLYAAVVSNPKVKAVWERNEMQGVCVEN